jgi:hypothetical protein
MKGAGPPGKLVEVGPRSMYVRFASSIEPSLIHFDDPEWTDYITFAGEGAQPHTAAEAKAEAFVLFG